MPPNYVVKTKVREKLTVIGSGFKQQNGVIRIQMDVIPYNKLIWVFPFEKRNNRNLFEKEIDNE